MKTIAAVILLALLAAAPAGAILKPKPKPWMWPPAKASTRLMASAPFVWDEVELQKATCLGRGKAVVGRYVSFQCKIAFGNSNMSQPYGANVLIRVLPVGTGKLCVVATPEGKAMPYEAGTLGITVADGKACP